MMFGYSDDWLAALFIPVVFWVPFGPFLMAGMGVWCARHSGWKPRLWSVLLPAVPVGVLGTVTISTLLRLKEETWQEDLTGFLVVYVLGITALPWLLGYGITRTVHALRTRRNRPTEPPA
ncbi:hypothetical protein M5362_01235 [Streptomyces sp. Je 1-79]|uniref:hypothetical protein n=1 Tax=Streptomyces sp. Je 1-79 TaxID=2943847 RepID=UPI0021A879F0|nr:hypothetical protein [Streptomyces sp. Je 1-79]MCT4351756.1 hypothetical protein [Streptomyces sp. Je 1-79]